jgi:hypothetical protein
MALDSRVKTKYCIYKTRYTALNISWNVFLLILWQKSGLDCLYGLVVRGPGFDSRHYQIF